MVHNKNKNNKYKIPFLVIVFTLFLILLYLFYKYNNVYEFVFNNPLGNVLIIFVIGICYWINNNFGMLVGFLVGLLYLLSRFLKNSGKEGFTWSQETIDNFNSYEKTNNPNVVFDVSLIQNQASQEDVDVLLSSGMWPWSEDVQQMFMDKVQRNTMIKTSPVDALNKARTIYTETAAKELLSVNSPEGMFLNVGVLIDVPGDQEDAMGNTYGVKSGLVAPNKNTIRCGTDKNGDMVMQETQNMGNDGITSVHSKVTTDLDYTKLPDLIPGFSFLKGPCNPCVALKNDYSCPFSLHDGESGVSSIWKNLWGFELNPETRGERYPLLNRITGELNSILSANKQNNL